MSITVKQNHNKRQLERIIELLAKDSMYEVRNFIHSIYPAETAHIIESLEPAAREKIWSVIPPNVMGEILVRLHVEVASNLIRVTDRKDLIKATENLESDDMVDLLHSLPEPLLSQVFESIAVAERNRLESALSYDDNSAGGIMSLDVLTVRADVSLDVVLRYLRKRGDLPTATDSLIVTDRNNNYQGLLAVSSLLTKDGHLKVSDIMSSDVEGIPYQMPASEVALLFEQRNMLSAPVLSETGRLLGRITIDDVINIIRDEEGHSLMSRVGLDEEQDMFAPVAVSAKRRAVWLGINLFTAFLAAWVIGIFEATIDQIVALAVLMPIVASMGGIAGSQTLTLVIRGLALKQVSGANAGKLLVKEMAIGVVNGVLWACVVAIIAGLWFQSVSLGALLGSAMIINLICAAFAGATIPLALDKVGIDPALAGGVLLTTVTDVVGFMAFLGLATIFLL
ncbi:MAG: magnesium transporter [Methylococcaceae bacterium]|nr:magnesium transporter [Methylococcaceae bacterium]